MDSNNNISNVKNIGNKITNTILSIPQKTKEYYNNGTAALMTNPKYFALTAVAELIVLWYILYVWSPFGISEKFPALVTIVMIIVSFINVMMYIFVDDKDFFKKKGIEIPIYPSDFLSKVFFTVLSVLGALLAMYCIIYIFAHFPNGATIFNIFMYGLYGVVGLSILYFFLKPYIDAGKKQGARSVLSLLGSFIMYIPCTIIDLIDWVKEQYNITTSTVWILLGLEALLVGLSFIVPKLISMLLNSNGKHLLKDPIYLNKQKIIGKYSQLYDDKKDDSSKYNIGNVIEITNESPQTKSGKYKYIYSISAWFWLNPQPPNTRQAYTKYTNILEYGNKPVVEYNGLENSLRVRCQIEKDNYATIFETNNVNFQTWNNIVINYDGGNMDVFLNGELVGSRPNIAPYMSYENIVVGQDKGLEGGIANVVYYDKILQKNEILMSYKTLKNLPSPLL